VALGCGVGTPPRGLPPVGSLDGWLSRNSARHQSSEVSPKESSTGCWSGRRVRCWWDQKQVQNQVGPDVEPVVGLEVGPDVGPEVGPDVGLEVGLDVGLKVGR
jgi:hypothetical protein